MALLKPPPAPLKSPVALRQVAPVVPLKWLVALLRVVPLKWLVAPLPVVPVQLEPPEPVVLLRVAPVSPLRSR